MTPQKEVKAAKSNLTLERKAGVLLHISSLPSANYVGDLGENAKKFVDVLHKMKVKVWQTLPINMPHADNSPLPMFICPCWQS